jgi:hypothetical protein
MQASKMRSIYVVAGDVKTSGKRAKQNPKSATQSATPPTCFCSTGTAARARGRLLSAKSDAETLVADVENTLSDLFVNCLSRLDKCVINIVSGLCTSLQEHQAVFFCECLALLGGNLPLLLQITLVTNKHDGHVVVRVLPRIFEPRIQVIEGLTTRHIVHEQRAGSTCSLRRLRKQAHRRKRLQTKTDAAAPL